ncbi:MAG: TonB-dependent siderophore receptor [Oceanipulchritudo sp.]
MNKWPLSRFALLLTSPLLLAPLSLPGQEEDGDIFELSAFEVNVSGDRGYISSNAISAYRINLPIQDIPIQIKVVTRDFLNDVQAVNLEEALGYSVGVTRDVNEREDGRFSIRGLQAAFPKRNGYRRYYTVDMTNVERVEVIKGPASALFGEAQPGGIINYVTKKPLEEERYGITATYGSYDYIRAVVEATGPLNEDKSLLYRIDTSYLDRNDYRDFSYEKRKVAAPVLEWRPSDKTTLRFDFEYIERDFLPPSNNVVYNEVAYNFYQNLPEDGIINLKKLAADSEIRMSDDSLSALPFIKTWGQFMPEEIIPEDLNDLLFWRDIHPGFPREFSSTGPDSWDYFESQSWTLEASHKFSNESSIRFAASTATIDTAYVRARPNRVRIYGDGFYRGQRQYEAENVVGNLQLDYLLPLDFGWSRHTLIFGTEVFQDEFQSILYVAPILGSWLENAFASSPIPSRRIFADGTYNQFSIAQFPVFVEPEDIYLRDDPTRQERLTYSFYMSDQMVFFNERLKVLAGVRYDHQEQDIYYHTTRTGLVESNPPTEEWSPQIGANFELRDGVALYANYSKSFSPGLGGFDRLNPDGSITPSVRPPELGIGYEAGIKLTLLNGRLSGTMAWFDIEKNDVTITLRNDVGTAYNQLVDDSSTGFEMDFAYEPFTGLQFLFGYAYIDSFRNDPTAPQWVVDIESRVPGVPENQVTFWTKYKFLEGALEGFSIGGGVQWMQDFRGSQALPDVLLLDGYTKVDLLLSYALPLSKGEWKCDLFIDNVLDEDFYYPGPVAAYPRNFKITIKYTF